MNALDYALLVLGLFVIYLFFFKKKDNEEVCLEKVEIEEVPLLEETPMNKESFIRPKIEENKVKEKIPIKKVEKVNLVEKDLTQSKKKVIVKSSNTKNKKRIYNEESSKITIPEIKTPYRKEDTMNNIAPVLPIYENEPAVPLYEPSILSSLTETSSTVVEKSSNDVSFNNDNNGFGGSGSGDEY